MLSACYSLSPGSRKTGSKVNTAKSSDFQICQMGKLFVDHRSLSLQTLALSHFGRYYLNNARDSFEHPSSGYVLNTDAWSKPSMHRWVVTAAAPLTGCKNPWGHFPQHHLSILFAGTTAPCSSLCWVCHRTLAKMLQSEQALLIEWKMGSRNAHQKWSHIFPEVTGYWNQEDIIFFFNLQKQWVFEASL